MEAVIIAAGMGTRLGPIGQRTPKCLLEINGEPLLAYQLRALREAGFLRITIVTGHLGEVVRAYCKDKPYVRIVENDDYKETGGAFSFLRGVRDIHDDVLYLICDMLYEPALVKRLSQARAAITIGVQRRPTDQEDMKVRTYGEIVTAIGKDIPAEQASGEFLGAAYIPASLLSSLKVSFARTLDHPEMRRFHFGNALAEFIREGAIIRFADLTDLFWCEIDTPMDLIDAGSKWGKFLEK